MHLQIETGINIMCRLELIANKNTQFMCRPGYSRSASGSIELNHHNCNSKQQQRRHMATDFGDVMCLSVAAKCFPAV